MKNRSQRRYATHLMTAIVLLVTGSVVLISGVLYLYFEKRLESEFNKKILAQKGQIEIILKNRIAEVRRRLDDVGSDNTIRVTMMMRQTQQLEERIKQFSRAGDSMRFFILKQGEKTFYPKNYPGITGVDLDALLKKPPYDDILVRKEGPGLFWLFDIPIMHKQQRMGMAYVLYNLARDKELLWIIEYTVIGDVSLAKPDGLQSLIDGAVLPLSAIETEEDAAFPGFFSFGPDLVLCRLDGFKHLYFSASKKTLLVEKKRISMLIGLFSIVVLAISAVLSIFLGKQMGRPIAEMASKAIQISEGEKNLSFETEKKAYLEFNQLSKAFNFMLLNLKDAEEKARFNELLENVDDAVYLIDQKGKILEANEATYLQLGYTHKNFFNRELNLILPDADAKMLLDRMDESEDTEYRPKLTFETVHQGSDGQTIPVEIKSRRISYQGQTAILNVARDIRERKEAEEAMRESEERYRSVVENSHDAILILDERLHIIYANNELYDILDYPRNEVLGKSFKDFLLDKQALNTKETGHEGESGGIPPQCELDIVKKNGERRHGKISATTIKDSAGNEKILVHILDVTDQVRAERDKKQLEAQLRHSQKMEAVGTLAGGVAHDFNNLLQAIQGYTELLIFKNGKNNPDYKELKEIKGASQRASELTQQLLTFSRKVESNLRPVDLNNEIRQVHKLLKRTIPKMIETELHLDEGINTIKADPAQLGQVIMNLVVNARDAMPDGGTLVIETKNVTLDEAYSKAHLGAKSGDFVLLTISDNGQGMNKETLEHIFEPFYTTKETGKGTGLGLAIVYGIIKNHDGYIMCYSEPEKGTTFKIYLPSIVSETDADDAQEDESLIGGNETLLLVDDDEHIISLGYDILTKFGYRVLTAVNGNDALTVYQKKQDEIDLVIIDLIMPEMDGKKCIDALKKQNPDVKIVIASGFSPTGPAKKAIDEKVKGFVGKPYELQQMLKVVRSVLDAA